MEEADVSDLIERLAARYWDLDDTQPRQTLDSWLSAKDAFVALTLQPERIRQGA